MDMKATDMFNYSPNRFSSSDHVSYSNIPPFTTHAILEVQVCAAKMPSLEELERVRGIS